MVFFSTCKINIGLHIINKRDDGYHNIETIFYPIGLKDAVEIVPADTAGVNFTTTGNSINIAAEDNICVKAYYLLKAHYPLLPGINMHLHKVIPMGAGLGGGSGNASAVLLLLNKLFNLQLSTDALLAYALQLGSDCPFFIINKPCIATARGELLTAIKLDLSPYKILLITPPIHVSTQQAFAQLNPNLFSKKCTLASCIMLPINTWKDEIKNDFESTVFVAHPQLQAIKEKLYQAGAIYSAMSGSGSTVYGIFNADAMPQINFPNNYSCHLI